MFLAVKSKMKSMPGLPSPNCILLVKPGIGGIACDCVIAVAGVSQVVLTVLNLAQESCQLAGSPQAIARVTGRTSPDPLKNGGKNGPDLLARIPGPKLCPNIASMRGGRGT